MSRHTPLVSKQPDSDITPDTPRELLGNMHRVVSLFAKLADQLLSRRLGLSLAQFRLLAVLECSTGTPQTQRAIADALDITEAAVSRHIRALVACGFILADRNRHSRRMNDIAITAAGSVIKQKALELLDAESHHLFGSLSYRNRIQLSMTLRTALTRLAHAYPDIITHEQAPPLLRNRRLAKR
jgi:DNA-binding MarR family transcriptional regulator